MQKVVEDIKSATNRQDVTAALFLDFRKAFDTVLHDLLGKQQKLGFDSVTVNCFESYLQGRSQNVHCPMHL